MNGETQRPPQDPGNNARRAPALVADASANGPWLISGVSHGFYALPAMLVQTMVVCPDVTVIPHAPAFLRGVIDLRGQVMPLIDLRMRLGLKAMREEKEDLCRLLDAREEDHKKWLNELELSIKESRQFRLTTDPHKCAFGQWYDAFKPDDLTFSILLKKFDEPHRKIHGIAAEAQRLQRGGDEAGAMNLIAQTRQTVLAAMLQLFAETKAFIRQATKEIVIVLEQSVRRVAITVDKLEAVETLAPGSLETIPASLGSAARLLVRATGKRNSGDMVLLLDTDQLFCDGSSADTRS